MRVGIVVPKFGRSAVERNRVKRRLRELVRRELLRDSWSLDLVVNASATSYERTFSMLREEVRQISLDLQSELGA